MRFSQSALLLTCLLAISIPPGQAEEGHDHHAAAPERYTRSVARYQVPDVTLVDTNGSRVPLRAELDREGPLLLQFLFSTCATVCPVLTGTLAAAQDRLPGVRMVSISIDPEQDTPARLREYAARFHAGRQWRFLTGRLEDVVAVQDAFDAYRGDKMRHLPLTFLRASPHDPWVRLDGFLSAAELDAEVRRLRAP